MTTTEIQQRIIKRYFPDDMTIEELEDLHRNGDIDLGGMMENERNDPEGRR